MNEPLDTPEITLDSLFEQEMGVPLNQALETYNRNYIIAELGNAWDASPKEVNNRIETVKNYIEKLDISDVEKEKYTTIEGVQQAWLQISQAQQPQQPKASSPALFNRATTNQSQPKAQPKSLDPYKDLVKAPDANLYQQNLGELAAHLQGVYFENFLKGQK